MKRTVKKAFWNLFTKGLGGIIWAVCGVLGVAYAGDQGCTTRPQTVWFAQETWTEIRQDLSCGFTTIIIPVGGTEQSGPYIAVGKHNERVRVLAERIAKRVGHTLVAPVIAYVPEGGIAPRTGHMRFPGTITIPEDVFERLVISIAESLRVQGFSLVVLLGDHGGYQEELRHIAQRLEPFWERSGARILYVPEFYNVIPNRYAWWLRQQGYGADIGRHAGLSDTSLMLAANASMVRQEALRHAPAPSARDGIYGGNPARSSAALGQMGLSMQVDAAVRVIETAQSQNIQNMGVMGIIRRDLMPHK
ncbi:MAG: creatininase family protein [Acetobacter sp.]|nr:creatininase family protein [Acetobacter sp.]MBR2124979.1 creatininase family protein [Acetobacter sp.]